MAKGDDRPRSLQDHLYAIENHGDEYLKAFPLPMWYGASSEKLRGLYEKQKQEKGYQELLNRVGNENVMGIWDDHDYGMNDAGKEFENKDAAKEEFLRFFDVPKKDPRWTRPGIYSSKELNGGKVKVILLDNRYFRDPYSADGDILGEDQWRWLEEELRKSTADTNLIVSGIQILPTHFLRHIGENWSRMPRSRERLLGVIANSTAGGVILISGDVHFAELMQAVCICKGEETFTLPEITTSGMTHSWKTYPFYMTWLIRVGHAVLPWMYNLGHFLDINFGELDISEDSIMARIFDKNGTVQIQNLWPRSNLKPNRKLENCICHGVRGPDPSFAENFVTSSIAILLALAPEIMGGLVLWKLIASLSSFCSTNRIQKDKAD